MGSNGEAEKKKNKGEWIAPVEIEEGLWQFIDRKGNVVIDLTDRYYYSVSNFDDDGKAAVIASAEYNSLGFINTKGEQFIQCAYDNTEVNKNADYDNNGLLCLSQQTDIEKSYGCVDKSGEEVIPFIYKEVSIKSNGLVVVCDWSSMYGLLNSKGEEIVPCQYDHIGDFGDNGLAPVRSDNIEGYIDETGEEVIPCQYLDALPFVNGKIAPVSWDERVWVQNNGHELEGYVYGFINEKGEEVLPAKYEFVEPADRALKGLSIANTPEERFVINGDGKEILSLPIGGYSNIFPGFDEDTFIIEYADMSVIEDGKMPIPYEYVEYDHNGKVVQEMTNEDYHVKESKEKGRKYTLLTTEDYEDVILDDKGNVVLNLAEYNPVGGINDSGQVVVSYNELYGVVNTEEEEVIPFEYSYVKEIDNGYYTLVTSDGLYGLASPKGVVITPEYDEMTGTAESGLMAVKYDDMWEYVDLEGNTVMEGPYRTAKGFAQVEL